MREAFVLQFVLHNGGNGSTDHYLSYKLNLSNGCDDKGLAIAHPWIQTNLDKPSSYGVIDSLLCP